MARGRGEAALAVEKADAERLGAERAAQEKAEAAAEKVRLSAPASAAASSNQEGEEGEEDHDEETHGAGWWASAFEEVDGPLNDGGYMCANDDAADDVCDYGPRPGNSPAAEAAAVRLTQFNRLRVYQNRARRRCWQGMYRDGSVESCSKEWVDGNFRAFFVDRVERTLGRWCYVPVGKQEPTAASPSHAASLYGMFGSGYAPELTPEVRFMMTDGDGDYCLSYSSASALHHLGDTKLPSLLVQNASTVEGHERQMEVVREMANKLGWTTVRIANLVDVETFNPLTACAEGDVLILHLQELDGAADHAVSIVRADGLAWIFDANRAHALQLSAEGLAAISYAGIVSATRLTPKPKVAAALSKKRVREAPGDGRSAKVAREC
jgi:hypothetical protein